MHSEQESFFDIDMTSAVVTMSAFQSPSEVKPSTQYGGSLFPTLDQFQSTNNFLQSYQSSFNPFMYLSCTTPSASNINNVLINPQQNLSSSFMSQNNQSKSSSPPFM